MKSKRAIKSPQNQERIKNLKLNVLVLSADLTPFTIGLSKKPTLPDRRHLQPLNEYHLPSEFANKEQLTPVYTDFTDYAEADDRVVVDPKSTNPLFLKAYYQHQILKYIKEMFPKLILKKDFIHNPEVWMEVHEDDQSGEGVKRFDVFGLKMEVGRYTVNQPELMISYRGTRDVIGRNLSNFINDLDKITLVVNRTPEVKKYEDVINLGGHDLQHYYPVVNKELQDHFSLPDNYRYVESRYEQASKKISSFYLKVFDDAGFPSFTGLTPASFFHPLKKDVKRVDVNQHQMVFGGGKTHTDAFMGLKNYGPWRSSSVKNPRILLIVPEGKELSVREKLINPFLQGDGYYPGAAKMTGLPLQLIDGAITYSNYDNPHDEIMRQISARGIQSDNEVIAFFCSTIPPDAPVRLKRHFYKVKSTLLKKGIQVQGVYIRKLEEATNRSVSYWHQNLCAAVLAKLGGIPWKSGIENSNELIIGIGAFDPEWSPGRFVGGFF